MNILYSRLIEIDRHCMPQFLRFSGLTTLKVHTSAFDHQTDEPDATPLVDMLLRSCPDLEVCI